MGLSLEASATKSEHTFQEEDPGFQHLNLLTLLSRVTFHLSPLARNGPEEHSMRARSHGTAPRGIHASPLARNGSEGHSMRARSHGMAPAGAKTCENLCFLQFLVSKIAESNKKHMFFFVGCKKTCENTGFCYGRPKTCELHFC